MRNLIKNIINFLPYEIKVFRVICRPLLILFRQIERPFYLKIKNLNFKLYPSKSLHQTGIALYTRIVEKKMLATIIQNIKHKGIFIDLGSHSGFYALKIYKELKKVSESYAFEIDPFSIKTIKDNIKINNLSKFIKIVDQAVSGHEFSYTFVPNLKNRGSSFIKMNIRKSAKKTITLSSWFNNKINKKIAAIKMDIEGQEYEVLIDLFKNIKKKFLPDVIVVEINPNFKNSKKIKRILSKNSYVLKTKESLNFAFIRK